jgi:crossover junction endodeoxyribonuclease RusA
MTRSRTNYVLDIPCQKPLMTANEQRRAKWPQVRMAKSRTASDVAWVARAAKVPPLAGPVRVTVTWWAPNARRRDPDSLGPFTKAALDALVHVGVLVDDSSKFVQSVTQQIRVDRDNPRITITLEADGTP